MPVTLEDVGKHAGVSRAAVSQVLAGKSGGSIRISDTTRERILKAADELNYVFDARARNLRQKKSPVVGVLAGYLDTTTRAAFLHSVTERLVETGRETLLGLHLGKPSLVKHHLHMFRAYRTQAVLILGRQDNLEDVITELIQRHKSECGPGIAVSANFKQRAFASVAIDNAWACRQILSLMRDDGRRRCLLVALRHSGSERLAQDFQAAAKGVQGIETETFLIPIEERNDFGRQAADIVAARCASERCGVLNGVDTESAELMLALTQRKVRVPDQVAIVGYGNHDLTRFCRPTLTTLDSIHATPEIAEKTLELLEKAYRQDAIEPQEYLVRPKLIVRESFVTPITGWAVRGEQAQ